MTKFLLVVTAVCAFVSTSTAQCNLDLSGWGPAQLNENFNSLDLTIWNTHPDYNIVTSEYGWGTEYYQNNSNEIKITNDGNNGFLHLTTTRVYLNEEHPSPLDNRPDRFLTHRSGMLMTNISNSRGPYGAFDMYAKMPADPGSWPAFWLVSGQNEVDIFDTFHDELGDRMLTSVISTPHSGGKVSSANIVYMWNRDRLSSGFHRYTCVWTPCQITFFLDNREINSVPNTLVSTSNEVASILLTMQTGSNLSQGADFVIDWVRYYAPPPAPNGDPCQVRYKSSDEYMGFNITRSIPEVAGVNSRANSIAVLPSYYGEVFYRGTDNNMYVAKRATSGAWSVTNLSSSGIYQVAGDVTYNAVLDKVIYRGNDGRLHGYQRDYNSGGWEHFNINNQNITVSTDAGSIATNSFNDRIFFKGSDRKLHYQYYDGQIWQHNRPIYEYNVSNNADLIAGDLTVDPDAGHVYYRGMDDRLQFFWRNGSSYDNTHAWVDSDFNNGGVNKISTKPGSVFASSNGIYFIDQQDQIRIFEHGTPWTARVIFASNNVSEKVSHGLAWNTALQRLVYIGQDGRIQCLQQKNSTWEHWWIDDHWDTAVFSTYWGAAPSGYSSICVTDDFHIFYSENIEDPYAGKASYKDYKYTPRKNNHLRYFAYKPCQVNNKHTDPLTDTDRNYDGARATSSATSASPRPEPSFAVFPNPVVNQAIVQLPSGWLTKPVQYVLVSSFGKVVQEGSWQSGNCLLEMSRCVSGIYMLRLHQDGKELKMRLTKE